jgi:hypothetical protein
MGKIQDPGSGINIPDPQHCLIGELQSLAMWPILAGNSQSCGASLSLAGISSHFLAGHSKSGAQDCNWLLSCQGLYVQSVIEALRKSNETRAWTKVSISDFQCCGSGSESESGGSVINWPRGPVQNPKF